MGGTSFPEAFDTAIRAENCLIQVGVIQRRPPMAIFLSLQPIAPAQVPPFTPIPTILAPLASTSGRELRASFSEELQEIKNSQQRSQQEMTNLLQTLTKEVTNLKKQGQGIRQPF